MSWSNATMGFCPNCSLCIESHNGCLHLIHPHFRMVSPYIWTPDFVWPGTRRPNPSWLSASGPWHIFTITPVPRLNDGSLQSLSGEGGEWDDCCKLWIGSFPHGLRSAPVRTTEKRSCHTATFFFFFRQATVFRWNSTEESFSPAAESQGAPGTSWNTWVDTGGVARRIPTLLSRMVSVSSFGKQGRVAASSGMARINRVILEVFHGQLATEICKQ